MQTASSPKLSPTHGAAALGALCGFLEHCSSSSEYDIRRLSYNTETWTRAFNIYLTQSDNSKPKPLRRLLLTLTNLVSKHPVGIDRDLLLGISTCTTTRAIRKQDDFANIKPAIQVLEHLISTGLIGAAEIAQIKRPEELGLSRTKSVRTDGQNPHAQQEQINQSVQKFAFSVLEWIQYPDCAPAVGRFLPVFFKALEKSHAEDAVHASKDSFAPLWISPVKRALECHRELWDVFETHILPGLLRQGPADIEAFLKILPFENIRCGNIGSSTVSDIRLCLLVAKTTEDSSLRKYLGQGESTLLDLESLAINLLEHSSSDVRIGALSLLVSSSASVRPFSRQVLRRLQQCIPFFHVEVNAKPRNEFIALMKKLCMRLRGATLSLLRRGQATDNLTREHAYTATPFVAEFDGEGPLALGNAVEQVLNEESHSLEEHLAFRNWYMVFLLQELRPTATYQTHITALKVLDLLTEQTVALRDTLLRSHVHYLSALNEYLPRGLILRPLTELLSNPFDDVRQSANKVFDLHLSTNSIPIMRLETEDKTDLIDQKAECQTDNKKDHPNVNRAILRDLTKAASRAGITGRADHADGFGRLYNLLFRTSGAVAKPAEWHESSYLILDHLISMLEKEINTARNDLLFAVSNMPLHGHLIALR